MKSSLGINLIECDLFWENPIQNRASFDGLFENIMIQEQRRHSFSKIDLIVLPEMFTTGFTMNTDLAESAKQSPTLEWLREKARKYKVVLMGSIIVKEESHKKDVNFYNRLYFVEPNGSFQYYDKRHLFRMAGENNTFSAGEQQPIFEYQEWKICPQICYDLRFPVWSRNDLEVDENGKATSGYDVLVYVANFPVARALAWNTLLPARAIENSCYCIGVNRTGTDGKGIAYQGESAIYSPKGQKLEPTKTTHYGQGKALSYQLSATDLQEYRKKFAVYLDSDKFSLM